MPQTRSFTVLGGGKEGSVGRVIGPIIVLLSAHEMRWWPPFPLASESSRGSPRSRRESASHVRNWRSHRETRQRDPVRRLHSDAARPQRYAARGLSAGGRSQVSEPEHRSRRLVSDGRVPHPISWTV